MPGRLRLAGTPAPDRGCAIGRAPRGPHEPSRPTHDFVVVEDDFECEADDLEASPPALRSGRHGGRVAYVATILQSLAPALRLGVLVASPSLVRAARALRRITTRHPPLIAQRTAAHLLALGHYEKIMARVGAAFRQRLLALRDALNHYLVHLIDIPPVRGGTAYWVTGPDHMDVRELAIAAESKGVLIQPAARFYSGGDAPHHVFRLCVSGIPEERIRPGVEALCRTIRALRVRERGTGEPLTYLVEAEIAECMAGATFLSKTVYGDPITIEFAPDGSMPGACRIRPSRTRTRAAGGSKAISGAGNGNEWSYGQVVRFHIALEGERIHWVSPDGRLIDSGILRRQTGTIERH